MAECTSFSAIAAAASRKLKLASSTSTLAESGMSSKQRRESSQSRTLDRPASE
eukprot:CAMPEP_0170734448 /NCGR_PEP_ID=MMETSP0437-20130122/2597_1 /TAXON_ID=0 /ORGANISM="Sexangularia sp." /LENGTH=52 /DNA_ID=CAMNT_0011072765 /DNA_START=50 /DNA_END=208 /DNA_ORIENTATION=-